VQDEKDMSYQKGLYVRRTHQDGSDQTREARQTRQISIPREGMKISFVYRVKDAVLPRLPRLPLA
jgi:hypothetical protein